MSNCVDCPLCGVGIVDIDELCTRCARCAGLQASGLASSGARMAYRAPAVSDAGPARVGVASLLGAAGRPYGPPPGVPASLLTRWRELALDAGPCADCRDPLCMLARSVIALSQS